MLRRFLLVGLFLLPTFVPGSLGQVVAGTLTSAILTLIARHGWNRIIIGFRCVSACAIRFAGFTTAAPGFD